MTARDALKNSIEKKSTKTSFICCTGQKTTKTEPFQYIRPQNCRAIQQTVGAGTVTKNNKNFIGAT